MTCSSYNSGACEPGLIVTESALAVAPVPTSASMVGIRAKAGVVSKAFPIALAGPRGRKVAGAEDVAARYLVYKLYDASRDQGGAWQELRALSEPKAIVDHAVERGWI